MIVSLLSVLAILGVEATLRPTVIHNAHFVPLMPNCQYELIQKLSKVYSQPFDFVNNRAYLWAKSPWHEERESTTKVGSPKNHEKMSFGQCRYR